MEDRTLTAVDKILLADIDSFTGQGATFFKSNATIAKEQGSAESTIKRSISKLKQRGLIIEVSFDGRTRHLKSSLTFQMGHNDPADIPDLPPQTVQNAPLVIQENKPSTPTSKTLDFGALDSPRFRNAWGEWKDYKRDEHRFRFKSIKTEQTAIDKLIKDTHGNQTIAIDAIQHSIANGWKGIFITHSTTQRDRPSDPGATLDWADQ